MNIDYILTAVSCICIATRRLSPRIRLCLGRVRERRRTPRFSAFLRETAATPLLAACEWREWRETSRRTISSNCAWNEMTREFTELERRRKKPPGEITLVKRSAMTVGAFSALQASKRLAAEPQGRPQKEKKTKLFTQLEIEQFSFSFFSFFHLNFSPLRAGILEWRWTRRCWRRRHVNKTAGLLISLSARRIGAVKTCLFADRRGGPRWTGR